MEVIITIKNSIDPSQHILFLKSCFYILNFRTPYQLVPSMEVFSVYN